MQEAKGRTMNEDEFVEQAQQDETMTAFLSGIADEARGGPPPKRFGIVGPDVLWLAAAYAVWSLMKIGLDYLRGKTALQLVAEKTATMKLVMEKTGLGLKQSKDIVDTALSEVTKRNSDDPILQAILRLLPGNTPSLPSQPNPGDASPKEIE